MRKIPLERSLGANRLILDRSLWKIRLAFAEWCGSCPGGNGSVIELTRRYEEVVKKNRMERWAPKDLDFKEFMKGLACLQKVSLCNGCLKRGGNPNCAIRICAKEKNRSIE